MQQYNKTIQKCLTLIILQKKTQKKITQIAQKFLIEFPDRNSFRILIVEGSGSGKTSALLNLINHEPDIDKIVLYAKDPYEAKYQLLINKRGSTGLKHYNDSKALIEYSNNMDHIYKNIEEYNPNKKGKILIVSDDMIADIIKSLVIKSLIQW